MRELKNFFISGEGRKKKREETAQMEEMQIPVPKQKTPRAIRWPKEELKKNVREIEIRQKTWTKMSGSQ